MDLYQQIFFTTLAVSFGILHSILFLYNPKLKSNLFFAIFLFLYALNIFFDFQASIVQQGLDELFYLRLHRAVMPYNSIFLILFTYYAFNQKIPKHFWLLVAALVITGFISILEPVRLFNYVVITQMLVPVEVIRIFIVAIKNKKYDAWIMLSGFILLYLFSAYDAFLDLNIMNPIYNIHNGYPFGFLCLIIFASIYLARDFARTNQIILKQEREAKEMEISQRLLKEEDKRKSKELDEARKLQLSMLPQCSNNIEGFDICFEMHPAYEVGGDYYDFHIHKDKTLTVAIGDATNHGMKAGMMVSIIKSLFLTHINDIDIITFFNKCSKTVKQMKLKNLYMALMLVKIKNRKLIASSSGMPQFYIYRKKTKTIDEFLIKGMPLGAVDSFPYKTIETNLYLGDTILLMSDGLPELFNNEKETFGYLRVKEIFQRYAELPSIEIAKHLLEAGAEWRKEKSQDDDITLAVIKIIK